MSKPDFKIVALRLVAGWKNEVTDGPFIRHAECEVGSPCTHVDDRLPFYIARALDDAYRAGLDQNKPVDGDIVTGD